MPIAPPTARRETSIRRSSSARISSSEGKPWRMPADSAIGAGLPEGERAVTAPRPRPPPQEARSDRVENLHGSGFRQHMHQSLILETFALGLVRPFEDERRDRLRPVPELPERHVQE